MRVAELHKRAVAELEEEKIELAKEVLKERIKEIADIETLLKRLKERYQNFLDKTIDEVAEEVENVNIRF